MKNTTIHMRFGALGLALGFALSNIGFADFDQLHDMFLFADMRLYYTFMGAVAAGMIPLALIARKRKVPSIPFHIGVVPGGIMFGIGWALCGCCPSVPLVQLGEGKLPALVVMAGLVAGITLYPIAHARFFRWDMKNCSD